jgi:hypothetical protein
MVNIQDLSKISRNHLKWLHREIYCWVWRPKADERVSHPPWRAISFLHPEEMEV